ncbi:hypothetical protein PGB90_000385 [Kerria lacca]
MSGIVTCMNNCVKKKKKKKKTIIRLHYLFGNIFKCDKKSRRRKDKGSRGI